MNRICFHFTSNESICIFKRAFHRIFKLALMHGNRIAWRLPVKPQSHRS